MPVDPFAGLPAKDRTPGSAHILDHWVQQASTTLGAGSARTGWILASTIVIAALQRALGPDGEPLFLLKGGVYLERRLGANARATKDVDTLFRGNFDEFSVALDQALAEPWGAVALSRTEMEIIDAPRMVKPRRFDVLLNIRGVTWRRIQVEVAFGDGHIGDHAERIPGPATDFFGITSPETLVGIAMDYQVAQKLHACTDPHQPPVFNNDRVRDIVDLTLIRGTFYPPGAELSGIRSAATDIFSVRAAEAVELGHTPRSWPPRVHTNPLWEATYRTPADQSGIALTLQEAIADLNDWIDLID